VSKIPTLTVQGVETFDFHVLRANVFLKAWSFGNLQNAQNDTNVCLKI
jgi:hypothetical protein